MGVIARSLREMRGWFSGETGRAAGVGLAAMALAFLVFSPSIGPASSATSTGVTNTSAVVSASGRVRKAIRTNKVLATCVNPRNIISQGREVATRSRPILGATVASMKARCVMYRTHASRGTAK